MKTVRLTMAQALVRFLENQYIEVDGAQSRFVRGVFTATATWWALARR